MRAPIRVFEYEKLMADSDFFPSQKVGKRVIDKLWAYNDANRNVYFQAIRNGVKFNSYVGVIQIGSTVIEILPKTNRTQRIDKDDVLREQWQKVLLSMLKYCKKIKISAASEASLSKRYNSLLDLYFEKYIEEVNQLIHKGLIKKYIPVSKNIQTFKGQIQFAQNIQRNVVHKERVFTRHQVYSKEHELNQILLKGLKVLKLISTNPYLQDKINRTLLSFPEIEEIEIHKTHFDKIVINRKNQPYQEALQIAKMIILNYSPDIKGGDENMLALLFDMNKLWEEYVYRMLVRASEAPTKIHFQNQQDFWNSKRIKPDIVIKDLDGKDYVIDTKWKMIDPKFPCDNDLKQMYVYNMYWNVDLSMLLYPFCGHTDSIKGKYHKGTIKRKMENEEEDINTNCKVASIEVVDSKNSLNLYIGKEILGLLRASIDIK
ncbi:restriction endonuclease [Aequorivita sp. H23M31]|uniref:Restriction endonuclease n=1 Tax=Aequorivita ciconiae TaxID=2494375 RepID=A0A410G0U9_9FLAO|nr:restriction endonuclease [Aequorivita sp. H23M31]QAA80871.1 restriction endonuclease [Aequorivita sp. H23M31]